MPRRVGVFAAAGSRALLTVADTDGMGSVAKTVRSIQAMFRDEALTRIYTSDAYGEVLINVHADLAPAIGDFLFERLEDELSGGAPSGGVPTSGDLDGGGMGAGDVPEPRVIESDVVVGECAVMMRGGPRVAPAGAM